MCDYSLHVIPNRLASEGERLMVHRFRTGSIGLAPAQEAQEAPAQPVPFWRKFFLLSAEPAPACAVCIPPGAKLLLHGIPSRLRKRVGVEENEEVTFTQLTADEHAYRDAVRFKNGTTVLLQRLEPGQLVEVLKLTCEEEETPEVVTEIAA
jgi:hypothetical protein